MPTHLMFGKVMLTSAQGMEEEMGNQLQAGALTWAKYNRRDKGGDRGAREDCGFKKYLGIKITRCG